MTVPDPYATARKPRATRKRTSSCRSRGNLAGLRTRSHVVAAGDVLSVVAQRFEIDVDDTVWLNPRRCDIYARTGQSITSAQPHAGNADVAGDRTQTVRGVHRRALISPEAPPTLRLDYHRSSI
jgi:LysM repeat protein